MSWLVVETDPDGLSCEVGAMATIGRARTSTLRLRELAASRHHCTVRQAGTKLWIQDDGSTNGTQVNGVPVRGEVLLHHRDRIQIGSTAIRVLERSPELPPGVPAAILPPPLRAALPPMDLERTIAMPSVKPLVDAFDPGPAIENGLLVVGRDGALRVQLWNVRIDQGGFFLRIPLVDERPPSSRLHRYVAKGRADVLVVEPTHPAFQELLARARGHLDLLPERERVVRLTELVFDTLGGLLSKKAYDDCLAWCAAQDGRPVAIGDLIARRAGTCRHRAFLFFHLAERLGLKAELYRGTVADSRHAWNVVRVGDQRVFVDATIGVVLDDPRDAEEAFGYQASRHDVPQGDAAPQQGRLVAAGDGDAEQVETFRFRHELRKVPGDEEAVLLLYPEGEVPAVRYLHVNVKLDAAAVAMFAIEPFVSARVFAIVGDEAHHRMDALDRDATAALRRAWPGIVKPPVGQAP
jgi:hypothetical protein